MSKRMIPLRGVAGGNIKPATFVKGYATTTTSHQYVAAGVADKPIGVVPNYTRQAPNTPADDTYYAIAGDDVEVYIAGEEVELLLGLGGAAAWAPLKPNSVGAGIVAGPGDAVGAIALKPGLAADIVPVLLIPSIPLATAAINPIVTAAVSTTLTAAQAGSTILATATVASVVLTLPPANTMPGLTYTVATATPTASLSGLTGAGHTVHPAGKDQVRGNGFTVANGKGAVNSKATAKIGDSITVRSDGVSAWYITDVVGTWAVEA